MEVIFYLLLIYVILQTSFFFLLVFQTSILKLDFETTNILSKYILTQHVYIYIEEAVYNNIITYSAFHRRVCNLSPITGNSLLLKILKIYNDFIIMQLIKYVLIKYKDYGFLIINHKYVS